jgi:hypothetical protein
MVEYFFKFTVNELEKVGVGVAEKLPSKIELMN